MKFFLSLICKRKIAIEKTKAITPPNLLGIDRKIAYANKKYHSGIIWIGVLKGFAGIKFSGSFNRNGDIKIMEININTAKIIVKKSLIAKNFKNGILSKFNHIPNGFLDPFSCKKKICIIIKRVKIKGIKKWSIKNRVKVAWQIEKPPHNHSTIIFPIKGIAEAKLVITVAPQ